MIFRKAGKNILYLGLAQGTNYLVPIIAIPILLDRIGLVNYGTIALSQGLTYIFSVLADFGLTVTGTRLINERQADRHATGDVIGKLLLSRFALILALAIPYTACSVLVPQWAIHKEVFFAGYLMVVGQSLFPVWYFQGVQKMAAITILNLLSRGGYLVCILLLVDQETPLFMVNVYNGASFIAAATVGLVLMIGRNGMVSNRISKDSLFEFLRSNFSIFLATSLDAVYRNSAILLASFLFSPSTLALFAVLDKIMLLIHRSFSILYRAIFPIVCELIPAGIPEVKNFYIGLMKSLIVPTVLAGMVLYLFGEELMTLLSSEFVRFELNPYFLLIGLFPVLLLLNVPISTFLVAYDLKRDFLIYNAMAVGVFVTIGTIAGMWWQIEGLIMAILFTEFTILGLGVWRVLVRFKNHA